MHYKKDENGNKIEISHNEYQKMYFDNNKDIILSRNKDNYNNKKNKEEIEKLILIIKNEVLNDDNIKKKYKIYKKDVKRINNILDTIYI